MTKVMKNALSMTNSLLTSAEIAGWISGGKNKVDLDEDGNFNLCVPLSMLLGFAEDYKKIIINNRQELVLRRFDSDVNTIRATVPNHKSRIELTDIVWVVPYLKAAPEYELELAKMRDQNKEVQMAFRAWDLHENTAVPQTNSFIWNVTTLSQIDKPRYVIVGFQTDRKDKAVKDASEFDSCNVKNICVMINSNKYRKQLEIVKKETDTNYIMKSPNKYKAVQELIKSEGNINRGVLDMPLTPDILNEHFINRASGTLNE
ncbi:uncharacterized protein LOC142331647 [Lycorma delicatula]|uniref:uncharacterized protein LOC142331647 n=1 Tax=Lycorma delicatula TaxID=130591 RepID=UPI003F51A4CD